jgi:hypothetical protein
MGKTLNKNYLHGALSRITNNEPEMQEHLKNEKP